MLKCADYSITHVETKTEAIDWLAERRFQAIIVDCRVFDCQELHAEAQSFGVPVIPISTHPTAYTITGISAASVKDILATVLKVAPVGLVQR